MLQKHNQKCKFSTSFIIQSNQTKMDKQITYTGHEIPFNKHIDDTDMLVTMIQNLPSDLVYDNLKQSINRQMESNVDPITVDGFKQQLRMLIKYK